MISVYTFQPDRIIIMPPLILSLILSALLSQASHGADGTWNIDDNGIWSTANSNWLDDIVADDVGFTANFITLDITADRTVSVDTERTIGNLIFGDVGVLTAGGWILDNGGVAGNILPLNTTTPTITVNALAPVDVYAPKSVVISAVIAGSNGLNKTGAGRLKLSSTNTYTGDTVVDGSVLAIINDRGLGAVPASFSPTNVQLLNGASLDATATTDVYNAGNTVDLHANRGIYLGPGVQSIIKKSSGHCFPYSRNHQWTGGAGI